MDGQYVVFAPGTDPRSRRRLSGGQRGGWDLLGLLWFGLVRIGSNLVSVESVKCTVCVDGVILGEARRLIF